MTSAVDLLERQQGRGDDPTITQKGAQSVDLSTFLLDVAKSKSLDFDIATNIMSADIERTMDGASTLTVAIKDVDNILMESGFFGDGTEDTFQAIDVNIDGLWFRLVQVQKQGTVINLTFEDRIVAYMRLHKKHRKISRNKATRAEFARMLVREIKATDIVFVSPSLHKKQPIAKIKDEVDRQAKKEHGLVATVDLNVKSAKATKHQLKLGEAVLDAGSAMGANRKCMMAAMVTIIQESTITTTATNGEHVGLFQQEASAFYGSEAQRRDPTHSANKFFSQIIAADKAHPGVTVAQLAELVQRSGQPENYAQWTSQARKWVDEYGASDSVSQSSYIKSYEFHRGPPDGPKNENTWDCLQRLASEVRWRRFVVGNMVYFIDDHDLMLQKPRVELEETDEGINTIDFDMDQGKSVNEATVECRAERWLAPPGSVIKVKNQGPASGRWLVWTIKRSLFSTTATITLRQPESQKKEPAPEQVTRSGEQDSSVVSGGLVQNGNVRDAIVAAAKHALELGPSKYHYAQVRPIPRSMFQAGRIVTDCSGFATLCYKAAGAGDPNGFDYNGSGNTTTLKAGGKKINSEHAQPGDLVFYGSPDHVMVYIGDGQVIGMGGDPDPTQAAASYRPIVGIYRYDLTRIQRTDSHIPGATGYNKGNIAD